MSDRPGRANQNKLAPAFLQTGIVAAIGLVLSGAAQALYPVIVPEYTAYKFILGGVYGWLLGVLNFLAMALSLVLLTESTTDRQEGQKKAQSMYMARLVILLLLAVGGCFIPVFHPIAVLASLALTWTGVFLYSFIFKLVEARKNAQNPPSAENEEAAGAAPESTDGAASEERAEDSDQAANAKKEISESSEETKDGN